MDHRSGRGGGSMGRISGLNAAGDARAPLPRDSARRQRHLPAQSGLGCLGWPDTVRAGADRVPPRAPGRSAKTSTGASRPIWRLSSSASATASSKGWLRRGVKAIQTFSRCLGESASTCFSGVNPQALAVLTNRTNGHRNAQPQPDPFLTCLAGLQRNRWMEQTSGDCSIETLARVSGYPRQTVTWLLTQ
jgi:hypothetical protein